MDLALKAYESISVSQLRVFVISERNELGVPELSAQL
jgi:hypothetical protein